MSRRVLVLGANGRFGRHAAAAFADAGWDVTALVRPGKARPGGGARIVEADATDPAALARAAEGQELVVNALNPPYPAWARELPRFTAAILPALRGAGATLLVPGNVYSFGSTMPALLSETTPHRPDTRKGRLREEMERACALSGLGVIVLRAGDFIDTAATDNWFEGQIAKSARRGTVTWPGADLDTPHAWAFLPDLARAAVGLADRRADLPAFADIPFPGYTLTARALVAEMEAVLGRTLRVKRFPWRLLGLLAPVVPMFRELGELRYLWDRPHELDGTRFRALLPDFRATPVREAIAASLAALP